MTFLLATPGGADRCPSMPIGSQRRLFRLEYHFIVCRVWDEAGRWSQIDIDIGLDIDIRRRS
jgi:hypothetical protein